MEKTAHEEKHPRKFVQQSVDAMLPLVTQKTV